MSPRTAVRLVSAALALPLTTAVAVGAAGHASAAALTPWVSRIAIGSSGAQKVGSNTWAADTVGSGGTASAITATTGTTMTALLGHQRVGASVYKVSVPGPGVYRVSLLLPKTATYLHANVVAGSKTLVSGLGTLTGKPEVVSFSAGIGATTLQFALQGDAVGLSGLEVSALTTLPSGTVDPAVAYSNVPTAAYDLPTTAPGTATSGPAAVSSPVTPTVSTTWASGAWPGGGNSAATAAAYGVIRHNALDVIATSVPGSSWNDLATDFWGIDTFAGQPAQLAIALPMLPYDGTGTYADVLAGNKDWVFTDFARALVARGRAHSVVRLGWEMNGNWQPWQTNTAAQAAQYVATFQREVTVLRAADPQIVINWNGNFGPSNDGLNPFTQLYPGDAYVDQVGLDAYDRSWYHVVDAASWASYQNRTDGGLNQWYDFAVAHGKLFSLPEWGLYNDNGSTTDNPYYIQVMHDWFAAHASHLAYEAYFNDNESWDGTQVVDTLGGAAENPKAGALYDQLF